MTAELGQPGQIIDGKYRIVRLLGTGGMGAVFEGENIRIRRKVAIKMLHGSVSTAEEVVQRFENEAKAAGMVGSDHICEVLDLGELPDHTRYMVMEYLDGETMSSLIKRQGRLKPQQSIPILNQILDALGAAHTAGIIHRDLKPDNVFILPQKGGMQNFVKILDFGVSKFSQLSGEAMNVTRAGAVVGTPYYMSPEQARGGAVDARTDVYSIGVLLYQATTGQVPYQAETFNELLFKIVLEVAPPPQTYCPDLDPDFAAIIQRAMAREPDQRYPSCAQFKDALLQYQTKLSTGAAGLPAFPGGPPHPARTEAFDFSRMAGHPNAQSQPGFNAQSQPGFNAQSQPGFNAQSQPGFNAQSQPGFQVGSSGASWPMAQDGTMPMQPGLPLGGNTGPGNVLSPLQSGASWPGAAPVMGAAPPATTSNSWGNASSPANVVVKPRSGNGALLGVVAAAALIGIGATVVAVVMMGKGGTPSAPAAAPTVTAIAAPKPTVAVTAPAPATAPPAATTAAPDATTAAPAATTATPAAADAPSAIKPIAPAGSAKPGTGSTGKGPGTTTKSTKSTTKSGGNDLGY